MRYIVQLTGTQAKYGDDADIFQFQLWENSSNTRTVEDSIVDLTESVVTVDIANGSGFVGRFVTTTVPEKGIVNIDMSNEVIAALPADTYYFQVEVDNGTKKKIFPTDGGDIIKIFKSLTETQGELVPRTTIDDVLNRVDEKIAEYTKTIAKGDKGDKGDMDLSQITVGGRNLLLGTADWSGGGSRWNQRASVTKNTYRGTVIAATSKAWNNTPVYMMQNAGILQVGKTYTFSTYVRNTSDTDAKIGYYYAEGMMTPGFVDISLPAHTDWTRIFVTFQLLKDTTTTDAGLRWEPKQDVTNGEIQFAGYKLEEGNIATDWTPSPEDVDSTYIKKSKQLPAEALDFNYLATHMKTYQGTWWNGAQPMLNAPTNDWKWATIEVVAGFSENTGLIRTSRFAFGDFYSTNVNGYPTLTWYLEAKDANVVHNTGTETIAGDKTFTGNIKFSGAVNAGYLDKLTAWETPVQVPITMTGPFANSDAQGYITYQGSLISFNFGGQIGSTDVISAGDLVIGQLPSGVPLPIATIRGFISDVSSSKAPAGAIRINTGGSISMNLGDAYTPATVGEFWEMSATGFTKAVFAPLASASYQNIIEFSPTSSTQGATFTKDYYFAMSNNSTEAGLVVYNRNTNKSQIVNFGNGASNTGFVGHANDLAVLQDNSATNGSIWIGASHLYSPGMPIISYNPADGTVTKRGIITFATDEITPRNLIISSIIHIDMVMLEIIVSASGKYWKGTFDRGKLTTTQNITVTEVGTNMLSSGDYAGLVGSTLSNMLSVGQADWLEGDKFYKVRTATTSTTLSVVIEFTMVNKTPKPTGRYWMTNYPSWANNEIEKVWVENGILYANINRNNVTGSTNIIAKLADL